MRPWIVCRSDMVMLQGVEDLSSVARKVPVSSPATARRGGVLHVVDLWPHCIRTVVRIGRQDDDSLFKPLYPRVTGFAW